MQPLDGATARPAATAGLGPRRRGDHCVSLLESIAARARDPPREPADVDSAARPHLRVDQGRGARASANSSTARSSSPPITRATWTRRSFSIRCRRGWRYRVATAMAKEFFKPHFYPEQFGRARVVHQQPELLSRRALLQRVSAAAARGRHAPDAALHRRARSADGYSVLIFPEGKRTAVRRGRPVPARHRDDRVAPRSSGRPGQARRARPHPPSAARVFPRVGRGRCAFGAPISLHGNDYAALATHVEAAVRTL